MRRLLRTQGYNTYRPTYYPIHAHESSYSRNDGMFHVSIKNLRHHGQELFAFVPRATSPICSIFRSRLIAQVLRRCPVFKAMVLNCNRVENDCC